MDINNKFDYCKKGAEMLSASINFGHSYVRRKGYFEFLCVELAHAFTPKIEKEFSEIATDRIEHLIGAYNIGFGKIICKIPKDALSNVTSVHDFFNACELTVIDGCYGKSYIVDTKV